MIENHEFWLIDAERTRFCGSTLAATLYGRTDIYLTGELGAGKTTFLDGFSTALGISDPLPSPTFALEQRYTTASNAEFIHIDLYRLTSAQSEELLMQTNDHTGIRCIEWADRVGSIPDDGIHIHLNDPVDTDGRSLRVSFGDVDVPTQQDISTWRDDAALPDHIAAHCDAVADLCDALADYLMDQQQLIRKGTLRKAAEVHDLFRFIDFQHGAAHQEDHDPEQEPSEWEHWRQTFDGVRHEAACTQFLQEKGYGALADIVRVHGLRLPPPERQTIEQKLLYYADKRMKVDENVSLQERFDDFMNRYANGEWSEHGKIWFEQAKAVEQELFDGAPPL